MSTEMTVRREEQRASGDVHPALAAVDWDAFERAWDRYEDLRFRPQVERVLGVDAFEGWKGFTQALLSGEPPADCASFAEYAARMVGRLFDAADTGPPEARAPRRAFTAVYVYFAILATWELSDRHDALTAMVDAMSDRALVPEVRPHLPESDSPVTLDARTAYDAITAAARDLAATLLPQFGWENALFCSCPVAFAEHSEEAVARLTPLVAPVGDLPPGADTGWLARLDGALAVSTRDLRTMAGVLLASAEDTVSYARFLRDFVAPAADVFVDALADRRTAEAAAKDRYGFDSVAAVLDASEARARELSEDLEGNVFGSEARAFGDGFRRMAEGLRGPSLTVEEGEIALLFPFGMPTVEQPAKLVRDLVRPAAPDDGTGRLTVSTLLGLPVSAQELPMTNTFAAFGAGTVTDQPTIGARLVFPRHRLVLETTAHLRVLDIDLEVRLGSLGNHCVRVAVTTEHRMVSADGGPLPDGADHWAGEWTGHDVDQWVRRAGFEVGTERLWFAEIEDPDLRPEGAVRGQVVELAEALVADLQDCLLAQVNGVSSPPATDAGRDEADSRHPARDVNDLHANAHVLIVAGRLHEHLPDGSKQVLTDPRRLPELLGSQALLMPQRNLPTTLEDWVRHDLDPPQNLLEGIGLPDDLLAVNGDVTLLCALGSPSWAVVEIQQLVEFAVSVVGPLAAWSVWLRFEAQRAGAAMREAANNNTLERVFTESAQVAESIGRVRALLDHLRSAQLMRGHRDRQLLGRFMDASGMDTLEQSLDASVDSLLAQRSFGATQVERIVEQRQKARDERRAKAEGFLEGVLALIATAGLTQLFAWLGDAHDWDSRIIVTVELGILAVLLAVVFFVLLPRRSRRRRRDGETA